MRNHVKLEVVQEGKEQSIAALAQLARGADIWDMSKRFVTYKSEHYVKEVKMDDNRILPP